jgi:hypothetical protein
MATSYIVHRNRDGGRFGEREFPTLDDAATYAAGLARVSKRTIKRRIAERPFSSGVCEVSGRETGRDGVWIEEGE